MSCDRSVVFSGYSATNNTGRHDITEILLKVALNTISLHLTYKLSQETKCDFVPDIQSLHNLVVGLGNTATRKRRELFVLDEISSVSFSWFVLL